MYPVRLSTERETMGTPFANTSAINRSVIASRISKTCTRQLSSFGCNGSANRFDNLRSFSNANAVTIGDYAFRASRCVRRHQPTYERNRSRRALSLPLQDGRCCCSCWCRRVGTLVLCRGWFRCCPPSGHSIRLVSNVVGALIRPCPAVLAADGAVARSRRR